MVIVQTIIEILVIKRSTWDFSEDEDVHTRNQMICLGLRNYFYQVWNIIAFLSLSLSYTMIVIWIIFISDSFLIDFLEDPKELDGFETMEGFERIVATYFLYKRIASINCIFMSLHLLEYLSFFARIN